MPTQTRENATNPSLTNSSKYTHTVRPKNMGASTISRQPIRKR